MLPLSDRSYSPRLRPYLSARSDARGVVLFDPRRAGRPVQLSPAAFELARRMDGTRTLGELAGPGIAVGDVAALVAGLDEAVLLDGPAWHAVVSAPVREPACVGVYPDDPDGVRTLVRSLFPAPPGPYSPPPHRLRAVLAPHMDYARGGVTYGHAFRPLFEQTRAKLFVVVATSHHSPARFTLSRQHFRTPLGVLETDQPFIDRVVAGYGPGLFDDPAAHLPEHSVELEVPFVQLLSEVRGEPVRMVPLLVGSFHDAVEANALPGDLPDVRRMADALAAAEAAAGEEVCYVVSGDLAHIGPKFDDPEPVTAAQLQASRAQDEKLLACLETADVGGYFGVIAAEGDERRICGLPPTVLTLLAAKPTTGAVLHYQQYVHPKGSESVSFAAAAFYG